MQINQNDLNWLQTFSANKKRPLKVLHVGNIANNAYLNAKFLRRIGIEADVICYNYNHVMACPEWEELDIQDGHGDDFAPIFSKRDLRSYRRPSWFYQGNFLYIYRYIISSRQGSMSRHLWKALLNENKSYCSYLLNKFVIIIYRALNNRIINKLKVLMRGIFKQKKQINHSQDDYVKSLIQGFEICFPERKTWLLKQDIEANFYFQTIEMWREIFKDYDIIQCYGTDPALGLLVSSKPYVAFEHGTLRDFTQERNLLHCLTAYAYKKADHVFITNGDCLAYAKKLSMTNYSPMIHPVDIAQHQKQYASDAEKIKASYDADILLYCPLRHDWAVKGTDVDIRAFALFKCKYKHKYKDKKIKLILTSWGNDLEDSKKLIKEYGCEEDIIWIKSTSRIGMIKLLNAADVVLGQMILPCFGSTSPQALATGTPVIMSYRSESTSWIFDEPAPILSAFTEEEVADKIELALDPVWREQFYEQAKNWTVRYHNEQRVIQSHLGVYRKLLS